MQVKEIMHIDPVTVSPTTPILEVQALLSDRHLRGVPVVNKEGRVLGLITARDFFSEDNKIHLPTYIRLLGETNFIQGAKKALPYAAGQIERTTAEDIMNTNAYFADPDMDVQKLAALVAEQTFMAVPVADQTNILKGMIFTEDLLKLAAEGAIGPAMSDRKRHRAIDEEVKYVHKDMHSRFVYIARARANVWLTTATILFVVGFVLGIIYVADPALIKLKVLGPEDSYQDQFSPVP